MPEQLAGAVRADRLGARHEFGERRQHLAVALARAVVRRPQVSLDDSEDREQRDREADDDHGEQPVVGQHHTGDDDHQGAVDEQREPTPSKELGEGLDVAGDAGDERPAPLFVVVGEADAVDVADQPRPQVVQRPLAPRAEPHDRRPLAPGCGELRDDADDGAPHDESEIDALVVVEDAAVDRLLDDDRHDHPPAGAERGDQPGEAEPLTQDRCLVEPAPDRADGREATHRFGHDSPPAGAERSASKASTSRR